MLSFTLYDLLEKNLSARSDHAALIDGDIEVTYGELARRVGILAAWLSGNGVRRGDRIGIHLRKSVDEVVAVFAAARIGAVFVNLNYQWIARQLQFSILDCAIKTLITDAQRAAVLERQGVLDTLDRVLVTGKAPVSPKLVAWSELPAEATPPQIRPIDKDLAALLYTSGTTGKPKGVMFTHANILQGARSVVTYLKNTPDDRILGLLPMSFSYGMSQVTTTFLVGGTLVLQPIPMASEIVKTLVTKKVTGMAAVPHAWTQVIRYLNESPTPLPSLRYATNAGGKLPQNILKMMPTVLPGVDIYLMYGLTEAFRSTYLPPELFHKKMGAIGRAIPNAEVYVVDPKKGLCPPGETGELIQRGSLITNGYWGSHDLTAEKIKVCEHLAPLIGHEKVLYTGDLVREDEDGILWFVGRADGMIKCSGYRISPIEVEELVSEYDGTADVVAFGVENEELGQEVHVAVSAAPGKSLDSSALIRFCKERMPTYMLPKMIHLWEGPMPLTPNGKIDRNAVIQRARDGDRGLSA